jgi:phosphoesterase RecJ-like protein
MIKVSNVFPFPSNLSKEAEKFKSLLGSAKNILISSTSTSDGDSIGAQLGVYYLIAALRGGAEDGVWMIDQSPVPERYSFLKGAEKIISIADWEKAKNKPAFDLGITLDGGIERTGDVQKLFEGVKNSVLIDHHAVGSQLPYASKILDLESSSTCELVYHLYEEFNLPVTPAVAESLYVGIVFDTGFFKHSLTKPRTHFVASHLIATGIDFSKISDRALLERSWEAQLLLKLLLDNMERTPNGKIISSSWSLAELDRIRPKDGDQEGMINQLYHLEGTEVMVLFVEKDPGDIKISFRSKGKINVAEFARSLNPDGGGHIRAAGTSLKGDLSSVKKLVVEKLQKELS